MAFHVTVFIGTDLDALLRDLYDKNRKGCAVPSGYEKVCSGKVLPLVEQQCT